MKYNSNRSTKSVKNILYQIKIKNNLSKEIGNFDLYIIGMYLYIFNIVWIICQRVYNYFNFQISVH